MIGQLLSFTDVVPYVVLSVGLALVGMGWWWRGRRSEAESLRLEVEKRTRFLEASSRTYKVMVDTAYDLTAIVEEDGVISYANAAYSRVLGYTKDEVVGQRLENLVHPKDAEAVQAMVRDVLEGKALSQLVCRMKTLNMHKGREWVMVEVVAKGLPDVEWQVRQVVVHAHDVSAHKAAQDELGQSAKRFKDFAGSSADWLWEVNAEGVLTYVSPGVVGVLGCQPEALQGRLQTEVLFGNEVTTTRDLIASRFERREPYRDLEFWMQTVAGERVCVRLSGVPVVDDLGVFKGYRGAASNITASKLDRENMYRMATSDQLTGLLNRARFKEELERATNLSKRHHTTGVMMFIDLDRFKEVNDTHGHEAGDRILQGVAEILRSQMRSTDVVARLGGDEFGIIMHNIDMKTAAGKVERMIERVKAMALDYNGAKLTTTMSMGMVKYPQDDKGVDHLIMSADLAMYRAKDMGRNRLFVDDEDETSDTVGSVREQLKWVERLKVCLETGDFEMHYQAIVPAVPHQRPLFEALLRIYDSTGKVGNPALYIDAAEHFGLIQQLDMAITRRVFETQLALTRDGHDCDISINLSCRSLGDERVMASLKQLMVDVPVDPNRIIFEVTETMALHDPAEMRDIAEIHAFITELRALGFRFALDDFGSGFTSFKYLRVLDVDVVKIDGEFVKKIVTSTEDQLFVKHMVELCQGLGIMVIAEFVEDVPIMDVLLKLGVDYGQGWLFAKPRPDIAVACGEMRRKVMVDYRQQAAGSRLQEEKKSKKAPPKGNVVKLKVGAAGGGGDKSRK